MIQLSPIHHYIRINDHPAEITLTRISLSRYKVEGEALWGVDRAYGPNMGALNFESELRAEALEYIDRKYRVSIKLIDDILEVTEDNQNGVHGMNVTFAGRYVKAN